VSEQENVNAAIELVANECGLKADDPIIKGLKAEEERLEEQEKFAIRAEEKRKAELTQSRKILLAPFNIDTSFYQLGDMPEATFQTLLDSTRVAHEARVAAAKKAEEDRLAAIAAKEEEDKRVRAENERLRLEAVEKEREAKAERDRVNAEREAERKAADEAARKEREEAEAKLAEERRVAAAERAKVEAQARAERDAREKAEAELKAKQQAEKKKAAAEEKARKKAALAPDQDKIRAVAAMIREIPMPDVKEPAAIEALKEIVAGIERMAAWIEKAASTIGGAD